LLDVGEIDPETGDQREPPRGLHRFLQRLVHPVHVREMAYRRAPRVPQIGPRVERLLEQQPQLLRLDCVACHLPEGEQAIAEDHLADQLLVHELQRLAALRRRLAAAHEVVNRRVHVDREPDRIAARILSFRILPPRPEDARPDVVAPRRWIEPAGEVGLLQRLGHAAQRCEPERELPP
jgi:hypothetical protein